MLRSSPRSRRSSSGSRLRSTPTRASTSSCRTSRPCGNSSQRQRSEARTLDPQLLEKLEALEQRVEAPATADPVVEQLTQQLTHDLDAVREQVAKLERTPVTDPVVASELDTLSQRLRFLDVRLNEEVPTTAR